MDRESLSQEDLLWEAAFELSEQQAQVQADLEERYAGLAATDVTRLDPHQRELRLQAENDYWGRQAQLEELRQREAAVTDVLGRMATGEATEEEIARFLPKPAAPGEPAVSKRRRAIARQNGGRVDFGGLYEDYDGLDGETAAPVGGSNARRVADGRNRTRYVTTGRPLDPLEAKDEFYFQTSGSHHGKVRSSDGKNYRNTVGGRRIRKY